MLRIGCCVLLLAAACTGGDDSNDSQFEGDCDGSSSECGQISVRWTIMRPSQTGASTCADVDASSVRVTTTFQPDGRVATFTPACASGATLTPKMPLGPYALSIDLLDTSNQVIATQATTATIGVAGTVTEAAVVLKANSGGLAGQLFGTCSASVPCKNGNVCATANGISMCTPSCTGSTAPTVCTAAVQSVGGNPNSVGCWPTSIEPPHESGYCFIACSGVNGSCPGNLTCRDLGGFIAFACAP
jgi:hypothetical protein